MITDIKDNFELMRDLSRRDPELYNIIIKTQGKYEELIKILLEVIIEVSKK